MASGLELLKSLEKACNTGDLDATHEIFSAWFAQQKPDAATGLIPLPYFATSAMSAAATNDHPMCLAYLLQQGVEIRIKNSGPDVLSSAVCGASRLKSTRSLQVLLDNGWDINMPQSDREPPYMRYALNDRDLLCWFLDHGALPDATAEDVDISPLSYAVLHESFDTIKLLFDRGGSTEHGQLLNMASQRTDPDSVPILQFLFDHGDTRINDTWLEDRQHLMRKRTPICFNNATPLHHAARVGNIEAVRWLLDHGADPAKRSNRIVGCGTLPINSARLAKRPDIVEMLLQATEDMYGSRTLPRPIIYPAPGLVSELAEVYSHVSTEDEEAREAPGPNTDAWMWGYDYAQQDYSFHLMLLERRDMRLKQEAEGISAREDDV